MITLAIETSCDDTCVAVMRGKERLSNIISRQDHNRLGGIYPEYASRQHLELINPSIQLALREASVELRDVDMIAVTTEPGLQGSLIVGYAYAKMLALLLDKPLVKVNHLHGHILSVQYDCDLPFPYGFLLISGGHSMIGIAHSFGNYEILGRTKDDAAGECFDKVARSLGLQQPWGPELESMALCGSTCVPLPMPLSRDHTCDMSFSGLKTACIRIHAADNSVDKDNVDHVDYSAHKHVDGHANVSGYTKNDIAASFQNTVAMFLQNRIQNAIALHPEIRNWGVVGGVAANKVIRAKLCEIDGYNMYFPSLKLCTDNALMIAYAGYMKFINANQ